MADLASDLKDFIKSEDLLQADDKLLLAVSAGVDSMVLVHLLDGLDYNLGIAHANFQLRGKSADLDEQLVKDTADELKIPFHLSQFDTESYAQKKKISTQMAARELRYRWFEELKETHDYQKIATGHHLNDLLETLLLNITRGTGIAGLHGILPKRHSIVRPLLFAKKEQIINYANDKGLKWREDQSNIHDHYHRNLIRNQVVPLLKKINPSIEESTKTTVEILRSVEKQYIKSIDQLRQQWFAMESNHLRILKSRLSGIDPPLLADLVKEFGFNLDQCRSILIEAFEHTGKIFQSCSHTLNVDREHLIITPHVQEPQTFKIHDKFKGSMSIGDHQWKLSEQPGEKYEIKAEVGIGAFDLDKLTFPLKVRKWLPGDKFYPLGMRHSKKLSDFLIDTKVPVNYKTNTQVLISDDNIVWVVGHRVDDRYKVTEKTTRVLEIELKCRISNTD